MRIFSERACLQRQERAARSFGQDCPLIVIGAGDAIGMPGGADQTYPFVPHPEYYWLTGQRRSGGAMAYDPASGWSHFVRPVTDEERLWEGDPGDVSGADRQLLKDWLDRRSRRPRVGLGAIVEELAGDAGGAGDETLQQEMRRRLDTVRRPKGPEEIALVRAAVAATAAGYGRAGAVIRPGRSERDIQIELEAEMMRAGGHAPGYGTIVAAGSNAAVLHSTPGPRTAAADDVVLIDAGAQIHGYAADVTRTFAAGDAFGERQQAIYDIVLGAQRAAIARCRPGVEWREVHRTAAIVIATGLRDLGILLGNPEELAASGAVALFFPHGIGHMVGLGVRDVGGRAPGRAETERICGARLRLDMPLGESFLVTVEPGIYFVPALLDNAELREKFREAVAWNELSRWRAVGGVRIEDDVLVTAGDPEVLTSAIPK
ncbi:MAG: aminopeptidase P family protein [Candidatus Schekmanbacteria bacterium]|nr:aminopeptidase P family protein [Candidatus Schekmanbacteria bacterium]